MLGLLFFLGVIPEWSVGLLLFVCSLTIALSSNFEKKRLFQKIEKKSEKNQREMNLRKRQSTGTQPNVSYLVTGLGERKFLHINVLHINCIQPSLALILCHDAIDKVKLKQHQCQEGVQCPEIREVSYS